MSVNYNSEISLKVNTMFVHLVFWEPRGYSALLRKLILSCFLTFRIKPKPLIWHMGTSCFDFCLFTPSTLKSHKTTYNLSKCFSLVLEHCLFLFPYPPKSLKSDSYNFLRSGPDVTFLRKFLEWDLIVKRHRELLSAPVWELLVGRPQKLFSLFPQYLLCFVQVQFRLGG